MYGLTELARDKVRQARLVANPGCYPTAAQLPLIPLLREGVISPRDIIIDAKSGTTGAGRAPKQAFLFCEVSLSSRRIPLSCPCVLPMCGLKYILPTWQPGSTSC